MSSAMSRITFPAGTLIFDVGDRGDDTYLIKSGEVELHASANSGGAPDVRYLKNGQVFGEYALASSDARTDRAKAIVETECIVVSRNGLLSKLDESDPFIGALYRILAANMRSVRALGDIERDDLSQADIDALSGEADPAGDADSSGDDEDMLDI